MGEGLRKEVTGAVGGSAVRRGEEGGRERELRGEEEVREETGER
jgi:hypothetical protein